MAMIIKLKHVLSFIIWLFLFLILFHVLFGFKSNISTSGKTINDNKFPGSHQHRKMLATGFDFTPFINRHHHSHRHHWDHHHRSHMLAHPHEPKETEIDPRYGVDKRLVPTGPNPLHH
ncbi:CLAVATA3/ESR-RELATED [Trifolium repens]|nr:CLAVATA3/ESR-RELATED [Trifolium repens]